MSRLNVPPRWKTQLGLIAALLSSVIVAACKGGGSPGY
jgi:hypothetical protein